MSAFIVALTCMACAGFGQGLKNDMELFDQSSQQSALTLAELLLASVPAFKRVRDRAQRYSAPEMSHFSKIQTKFYDREVLAKSLKDLGYNALVAEEDELLPVRGYQGAEEQAEIVIKRDNKHDIGFKNNGKEFELVSDLEFWKEPISADLFLQKLAQKYAINTILAQAEDQNMNIADLTEDATGKVTLKLRSFER